MHSFRFCCVVWLRFLCIYVSVYLHVCVFTCLCVCKSVRCFFILLLFGYFLVQGPSGPGSFSTHARSNATPVDSLLLHHQSNSRPEKNMKSTKFSTLVSSVTNFNTLSSGKGYPISEATWEHAQHLKHAPDIVRAFHEQYPQKPVVGPARRP